MRNLCLFSIILPLVISCSSKPEVKSQSISSTSTLSFNRPSPGNPGPSIRCPESVNNGANFDDDLVGDPVEGPQVQCGTYCPESPGGRPILKMIPSTITEVRNVRQCRNGSALDTGITATIVRRAVCQRPVVEDKPCNYTELKVSIPHSNPTLDSAVSISCSNGVENISSEVGSLCDPRNDSTNPDDGTLL